MSTEESSTVTPLPVAPAAVPPTEPDARCDRCRRTRAEVTAMIAQPVERTWRDGRVEQTVHRLCGECEAAAGLL